jgi:hypothetical protein
VETPSDFDDAASQTDQISPELTVLADPATTAASINQPVRSQQTQSPTATARTVKSHRAKPPALTKLDLGQGSASGLLWPIAHGTAEANSLVEVSNGRSTVTVQADAHGRWTAGPLEGFSGGPSLLSLTSQGQSATAVQPFTLVVPQVQISPDGASFSIDITAPAGLLMRLDIDDATWTWATPSAQGVWRERLPANLPLGYHTVSVQVVDGDRSGPPVATTLRVIG